MRNILLVLSTLSILILSNSCKHDNFKDYVGPSLCPSSSFKIINHLSVSATNVNFKTMPGDTIKASFTEAVNWTVTITGQRSGAKKQYTGNSSSINIVWYGEPGQFGLPGDYSFFQTGEEVTVQLTIPCVETETVTVNIVKETDFSLIAGVVSDFDSLVYVGNSTKNGYNAAGWSSYFTPGTTGTETKFSIVSSPMTGPHGPNYLTLQGYCAPNSWYAGALEFGTANLSSSYHDPNDVYLNAFMSSGDNRSTVVGIVLVSNGTNYSKSLVIDWKGWRMVSIKFSDFKDKNGNAMPDAAATTLIDMGLNAATVQGQPVELDLDLVMFTYKNPFFH